MFLLGSSDSSGLGAFLFLLVVGAISFLVYLAPLIIATKRNHPQVATIAVINIFVGWTFVGWVVALAWSVSAIKTEAANPQLGKSESQPTYNYKKLSDRP